MKISRYIMITLCVILSLGMISCDKKNPAGGKGNGTGSGNHGGGGNGGGTTSAVDYTLTTQADVDALGTIASLNTLIIEGTGITSLTSLNVTSVNTLIIRNTSITDLVLPSPMSVQTQLLIENNAALTAISEMGLQMVFGEIVIKNNTALTDISGFLGLSLFQGSRFAIEGNTALGEDKSDEGDEYGFNVIKKLINDGIVPASKVTLSNNHPDAATDPTMIGQMSNTSGYLDYVISSAEQAENFVLEGGIVNNLEIKGAQIDDHHIGLIAEQVQVIMGDVICDGTSFKTTENFFSRVSCQGSVILKNIDAWDGSEADRFFNLNGFKEYTEIKGDLILENVTYATHWGAGNGFAQITKVGGDLIVKNSGMQQLAFASLEEVGGDMIIDNSGDMFKPTAALYNFSTKLTKIGGDFVLTNNPYLNGLAGFNLMESIGGKVIIKNNGAKAVPAGIPMETNELQVGYDFIQGWITDGVVPKEKVECYLSGSETPVVFN